jgi:hypothetical protein
MPLMKNEDALPQSNLFAHRLKNIMNLFSCRKAAFLFILLLAFLSAGGAAANAVAEIDEMDQQSSIYSSSVDPKRRKLWDFWSFVMLIHPPCPPVDAPHQPKHCLENNSSGSSTTVSAYNYDSAEASQYNGEATATSGNVETSSVNPFGWWLFPVAASVSAAFFAIRLGNRRNETTRFHEMSGAITRRVGAVSAFAEQALSSQMEMSQTSV